MQNKNRFNLSLILILGFLLIINYSCEKDDENQQEPPVERVIDIDGNVYSTITIGTQVWMVENLNVTKYRNGDPITVETDDTQWTSLSTGAYCNYANNADNASTYGRLYNWYAINDNRKIAPDGWHVASLDEWQVLVDYLGGENIAGNKLKESGISHWAGDNLGATNSSGFTALPGGGRYENGVFNLLSYLGYWWTATEHSSTNARQLSMGWSNTAVSTPSPASKYFGYSVRCIKD